MEEWRVGQIVGGKESEGMDRGSLAEMLTRSAK